MMIGVLPDVSLYQGADIAAAVSAMTNHSLFARMPGYLGISGRRCSTLGTGCLIFQLQERLIFCSPRRDTVGFQPLDAEHI